MRNKKNIKMKCIQDIVDQIDHSKKLMSGSISIREAIYAYQLVKSISIKKDYLDTVFNTALSIIIPMNNGVRIFIDTHPEVDFLKEKFPLEMPNKNGIFKRISFEILDNGCDPIIPNTINPYLHKTVATGVLYYADTVKERVVNEFIVYNGGIDFIAFMSDLRYMFD